MARWLGHPWDRLLFWALLVPYGVLLILKKSGIYLPFLSDHGADLLAMPVILSVTLWAIRLTGSDRRGFRLSPGYILAGTVMIGVLFEGLFPLLSDRHTADAWDLLAYGLGGIAFGLLQRWLFPNGGD